MGSFMVVYGILKMLTSLDKLLRIFEMVVLVITGVVILYALLYGALIRYMFKGSFPEEAELCWLMFTWMVMIGSSYVASVGDHPSVTTFKSKMGKTYNITIYAMGILTILVFLYSLFRVPSFFWERVIAPTLNLKQTYFYLPIAIGSSFWIIRYILKIIVLLSKR